MLYSKGIISEGKEGNLNEMSSIILCKNSG